jgi:hypothetical protein
MRFPSDAAGPTSREVGFFACGAAELADWIRDGLGASWSIRDVRWVSDEDAVGDLAPGSRRRRIACVPVSGWALVLTDGPTGTDLGLLPSLAARKLGVRAVRAVLAESEPFKARILEVFGPQGEPPLLYERSIAAANDGGRWVFENSGTPFDFEDEEAYRRRLKSSRFTGDMLISYLRALGAPVDALPNWQAARLVEEQS